MNVKMNVKVHRIDTSIAINTLLGHFEGTLERVRFFHSTSQLTLYLHQNVTGFSKEMLEEYRFSSESRVNNREEASRSKGDDEKAIGWARFLASFSLAVSRSHLSVIRDARFAYCATESTTRTCFTPRKHLPGQYRVWRWLAHLSDAAPHFFTPRRSGAYGRANLGKQTSGA